MERTRLVMLFANWYSGATLATVFLNAHPRVVSNGEAFPFTGDDKSDYVCSCGEPLQRCEFYESAAAHMRLKDGGWDRHVFAQLPTVSRYKFIQRLLVSPKLEGRIRDAILDHTPRYRNCMASFLDAHFIFANNAIRISDADVYLDGTKSVARALMLSKDPRYDIRAIHLIRDGRGFCSSYIRNNQLTQDDRSIEESTRAWLRYIYSIKAFQRLRPEISLLTIRHEDICRDTTDSLDKMFEYIGVKSHDVLAPSLEGRHMLGNRIRNSFFGKIDDAEGWRDELPTVVQNKITSRLKSGLKEYRFID